MSKHHLKHVLIDFPGAPYRCLCKCGETTAAATTREQALADFALHLAEKAA